MAQLGVERGHSFSFSGLSRKTAAPGVLVDQQFGKATVVWRKSTPGFRGFLAAHSLGIGIGIDVAVTGFFQIGADYWSNPFLTPGQRLGQLSSNLVSGLATSVATFYTVGFITTVVSLNPVGLAVTTIAVATGYAFGFNYISNIFQDAFGFKSERRNLRPL